MEFSEGIMKDVEKGDPGPNSLQKFLKAFKEIKLPQIRRQQHEQK